MRALAGLLTIILILLLLVLAVDAQPPLPTGALPGITGTPSFVPTFSFPTADIDRVATFQALTREPELPEADVPLFVIPPLDDVPVIVIRPLQEFIRVVCIVIQSLNG